MSKTTQPETAQPGRLLLSRREACERLGIGLSTLRQERAAGRIKTIFIGDRPMFAPADLDDYVETLRAEAAERAAAR